MEEIQRSAEAESGGSNAGRDLNLRPPGYEPEDCTQFPLALAGEIDPPSTRPAEPPGSQSGSCLLRPTRQRMRWYLLVFEDLLHDKLTLL
jgi:hypothetical protein